MNTCSSIDTDDILYRVICQAITDHAVTITGGVYPNDERPDGSTLEDIVINTIDISQDKPQSGTSNVLIYAEDQKLRINGKEQRKSARESLRTIGDALKEYFASQNIADLEFWVETDVTKKVQAVNQHYRYLRIKWTIH